MALDDFLQKLYDLPLSAAIREGASAFPWIESFHVLALVTVVGSIAIVDLRLLGVASHKKSVSKLITEMLPFTWVAFALAVVTGALLFLSNAPTYFHNTMFQVKMVLIVLAGLNMLYFHFVTQKTIHEWDEVHDMPNSVRFAGLSSLTLWILVVFFGRWIGFTLY